MLKGGILNPQIVALLARLRHTNWLVISDRGFPLWRDLETVDISLVDNLPTVLDVVRAVRANWVAGKAWRAAEFRVVNDAKVQDDFAAGACGAGACV